MKLRGGKAKEEVTSEHQGWAGGAIHTTNPTGPRYRRSDKSVSSNVIEVGSQGTCEHVQEEARLPEAYVSSIT
jgi:hypothetical protein